MSKRDKIIESFKYDDDKNFAARLIDSIEQVQKYFEPRFTHFLDPTQISKAERIIEQFHNIKYKIANVVDDCERNIIILLPDTMDEEDIKLPITALNIKCKSKFEKISHRDILGSLMSIGIKREKIGDIIVNDDNYFVIVSSDISYYIILNLTRIKHAPVYIEDVGFDRIPKKQDKFKEISSTVASMRLDSVLGCGFGESRASVTQEINKGNVKVNWEEVTSASHNIKEGDTISLRGRGRIKVEKVEGITKKGRIHIIIKRII